ncbi:helix-turn-helix domain-containing protein [Oxalicibacterium faecigallinarum]|uniref:Transcriptional regulator n=1 Tax=Oxalicibacterium faecigallinarum TaxID=573741 RepID=A0A8J3APH9_9BURK|nr:XRE family transcriptional regulator [Oxalicibacterium faecigallinarum]GGI18313.1 transcriptional regulator [Oxalicibacterium faecigallinarum]
MTGKISDKEEDASNIELQLGIRISRLRIARGFTQDQLATQTGFTKGYLSKIENAKVIPPIGTLVKICKVLQTDLTELLEPDVEDEDSPVCVVRSWQRESVIKGASSFGYDYAALANKRRDKKMEPFIMVFPSKIERDVRFEHEGEEFFFVLEGEVEFEAVIDGKAITWILAPGDSVYFDSRTPHRGRSLSGESRVLVVIYRA